MIPEIQNLIQQILDGDILGFLQNAYTMAFGGYTEIFYTIILMLITIPIYIRTKSIMFIGIAWILLGSLFVTVIPAASKFMVLILIMGLASILYQLFMWIKR